MTTDDFKVQFDNRTLRNMIGPLFLEQFLLLTVGLADTLIISYVSEAAVSGVTLVDQFNIVMIYLFSALAAGGSVVISQYIGRKDNGSAGESASQLLMFAVIFSIVLTVATLIFHRDILGFLFGRVEPEVMDSCVTYLKITALSYPAIAIYNAGAALYRSMGKTKTTLYISVCANAINVVGNIIGVFVLHAGIAGVAYPSLLARIFSAVVMTLACFSAANKVRYSWDDILKFNANLLGKILSIAVPNGIESGIFQIVKVALTSIIALFGTYQIAANGVAQSFWSVAAICNPVMGIVFITVIGQCMGASDIAAANFYFKKLMRITLAISVAWNVIILALAPLVLQVYSLEPQTKELVLWLILLHNIFCAVVGPYAFPLGNGLRATGDVKYTMVVAIASSVGGRFVMAYILGVVCNFGVMGVAWAMCIDWVIRAALYYKRQRSGVWRNFKVI